MPNTLSKLKLKKGLIIIVISTIIFTLVIFSMSGCSQQINPDNKVEVTLNIEIQFPTDLYNTFRVGTKNFTFYDELPISKYKVTLKDTSGIKVFEDFFTTSNIQFTIQITPGSYVIEIQAYTNSTLYLEETVIMSKTLNINLVPGNNFIRIPLEFLNGQIMATINLDPSVPSDTIIRFSTLTLRNVAKGITMEYSNNSVNSRTDSYTIVNVYPGVWDLEYQADVFRNNVRVGSINKQFSIIVYPSRLTSCDVTVDVNFVSSVSISITSTLPYVPPVRNITISLQNNGLIITYDYDIQNAEYRIYKKYLNENYWRFVGSTTQKNYTMELMPIELGRVQLIGINAIVGNLESGLAVGNVPPIDTSNLPGIRGRVLDAITGTPLGNVRVSVMSNGGEVAFGFTNSSGEYDIPILSHGTYNVVFSKEGYLTENYYNVVVEETKITLENVRMIMNTYSSNGSIAGFILNAVTGYGVANAQIELRRGINNVDGPISYSTVTLSDGRYRIDNVEAVNYYAKVYAEGYITSFFTVISIGGHLVDSQNAFISPILRVGQVRIVLTWGSYPRDLDSHLTGPMPDGSRFHVFFANKNVYLDGELYANLDLDDTNGYGPETITLYRQLPGVYSYYVHNYSDPGDPYGLSNSGAEVRVYVEEEFATSFNVPTGTGTVWHVFDIVDGRIIPRNEFYPDAGWINSRLRPQSFYK